MTAEASEGRGVAVRPSTIAGAGVRLAVDLWGEASDAPVVFLHGAGQSRRAWDEAAATVAAAGWHAVTVDHRGHGDSEWPVEADYDFEHFAGDLDAVVGSFEQRPVVVGASLGGLAALVAQGRSTEQLYRGLVLVDVTPRMELAGVKRIMGFMSAHPDGFGSLEEASAVIAQYTGRPQPSSTDGLRQVLRARPDGRWGWHWDVRFLDRKTSAALTPAEATERYEEMRRGLLDAARRVEVPTLVVRGVQSDLVTPEAVEELLEAVPQATFVDVAGAGHMVAGDQNDHFVEAVVNFLNTLRDGGDGSSQGAGTRRC